MCREKRFREDLYFRLNVIAIDTPALRDRPDDIPELSQAILNRIGKRRGQKSLACSSEAIVVLKQHSWPGNVRELENVLERASVFCETETIEVRDLSFPGVATKATPVAPVRPASLSGRSLDEIEKHAIIDTLEACGNNKAEAARRLGISEKSIYNKMRRFGLME